MWYTYHHTKAIFFFFSLAYKLPTAVVLFLQFYHLLPASTMPSILSAISCVVLTPIMATLLAVLGSLAIFTSALTSSFISIRLALLALEFASGLTIDSLSRYFRRLLGLQCPKTTADPSPPAPTQYPPFSSLSKRRRPATTKPGSISMPRRPYSRQVYSRSVPNTPTTAPTAFFHVSELACWSQGIICTETFNWYPLV